MKNLEQRVVHIKACYIAAVIILGFMQAGCTSPQPPMTRAAGGILTYFDAKREFANTLQQAILAKQSAKYRLVAVAGPAYPIGSILDPTNPVDVLTRNCLVAETDLPPAEPWAAFPTWTSKRQLELSVGLPEVLNRAIISAGIKINPTRTASYSISDVSQKLVPHSQFMGFLNRETCQMDLAKSDVLAVRGVVYGVESLTSASTGGIEASAKTKVTENLLLKYDGSGGFELIDSKPVPKFLVITQISAATRGGTLEDAMTAPADSVVAELERILQR